MAGLVKDYNQYKNFRNATFVGICTSATATVKSMTAQAEQFNLKPFANMLDAGGVTAASYGVAKNAFFHLVVVDGAGNIAFNASKGLHWTAGKDAGLYVHQTQFLGSWEKYPGVLGIKEAPKGMELAAHYFDLQQFDLLETELAKALKTASGPEAESFGKLLSEKVVENRGWRLGQIQALSKSDPVQAYREAIAFTIAFPKAPELDAARKIGQTLLTLPVVKKELDAEAGYQRILVPEMKKVNNLSAFTQKIEPLLAGYLKTFGDTKYADVVKSAVEAHRAAVSR